MKKEELQNSVISSSDSLFFGQERDGEKRAGVKTLALSLVFAFDFFLYSLFLWEVGGKIMFGNNLVIGSDFGS